MKKIIKVIDLLKLVYENKAPKTIIYNDCEYKYEDLTKDYKPENGTHLFMYLFRAKANALSEEVEIIEKVEKLKEIEPLELVSFDEFKSMPLYGKYNKTAKEYDKLEEIRQAVNYLLKKDEENDKQ